MMATARTLSLIVASALCFTALSAEEIKSNEAQLSSYTAQKYRVDFKSQNDKAKSDIEAEYKQSMSLGDALLKGAMKDDTDLHVATRLVAIDIWAKKFMQSAQVSDAQLQELYTQVKPKKVPAYRLRNILYKTEAEADKTIKLLSTLKDAKQLVKFKALAKTESKDTASSKNEGEIGWVELNKLDPSLQASIKEKKKGDLFKANMDKIGSQVILIEEIKPEKEATFEEAKGTLDSFARQQLLSQEIQKILKPNEAK